MNKRWLALLLLLLMALSACAAPAAPARPDAPRDLASVYQKMEESGALPPMVSVPLSMVPDFYGIEEEMLSDSLFKVSSDSLLADEVVLIRARDEAAAMAILALLNERMATKADEAKDYSPEQYAIIGKGQVLSQGLELALLVSPQVEKLLSLYQGK